jgi:hypothetical protein
LLVDNRNVGGKRAQLRAGRFGGLADRLLFWLFCSHGPVLTDYDLRYGTGYQLTVAFGLYRSE